MHEYRGFARPERSASQQGPAQRRGHGARPRIERRRGDPSDDRNDLVHGGRPTGGEQGADEAIGWVLAEPRGRVAQRAPAGMAASAWARISSSESEKSIGALNGCG